MESFFKLADCNVNLPLGSLAEVNLNACLHIDDPCLFMFVVDCDELNAQAIFKGDIVLVRRDIILSDGQLVVVKMQGKFKLRYYHSIECAPESLDKIAPQLLVQYSTDGEPLFEVFGVVSAITRRINKQSHERQGTLFSNLHF